VATAPQELTLKTHRDRKNWWQSVWIRRVLLLVPIALIVAGLANLFGQRPTDSVAAGAAAKLTVVAPTHGRSGIIYAARFRIDARQELKKATLVLDAGWADGYTVNGQTPQPLTEGSSNGEVTVDLGHIQAGKQVTFWLSLQINPTTIGRHRQNVSLYDGSTLIAIVHRSIEIFP
jgi:uncharacterized protein (DUF697 family)